MAWADTRAMAVKYVGSGRMVSGRIGRYGDGHDGTAVAMACHLAPSLATDSVRASEGAPPRCAPDPVHATLAREVCGKSRFGRAYCSSSL